MERGSSLSLREYMKRPNCVMPIFIGSTHEHRESARDFANIVKNNSKNNSKNN